MDEGGTQALYRMSVNILAITKRFQAVHDTTAKAGWFSEARFVLTFIKYR